MKNFKGCFVLFLLLFSHHISFSQHLVDITEQTLKIGGMKEAELLFGFAEGDQIVFSFSEASGKELKEIEILEYPTNSRFSDYKASSIEKKIVQVDKNGIYKFRLYNGGITGRVCKIRIQRIPATEATKNYNTQVRWVTKQDTTWSSYTKDEIVGYDTTYIQNTKKELVKSEQKEELLLDKPQRVGAAAGNDKSYIFFTLPHNQFSNNFSRKVVSWAYWIGVGEEANQAWKENSKSISKLAKGAATYYATPLGALAVGAITDLLLPNVGEDVSYSITDKAGATLFMGGHGYKVFDKGKGVAGYQKFLDKGICQGTYYICLYNDNLLQAINASVKVVAIIETDYYEDKTFTEQVIKPRIEKRILQEPSIKTARVPVAG